MININFLESLSPNVKNKIKSAYQSVANNHISPTDFFDMCHQLLSPAEFANLFARKEHQPVQKPDEIKTEYLQDVMQYSGVDLKQEAENIVKESENYVGYSYDAQEDHRNNMESLMNTKVFTELVTKICRARRLAVGPGVYHVLFLAIRRKLFDLYEKMIDASKVRVDEDIQSYIVRIDNDVRRQLWVLEQNEKKECERLKIDKMETDDKKKIKRVIEEREDLLIKKRMSNTVALAALGIQQKSWMSTDDVDVLEKNDTQFQSLYSPFNEKDLEKKVINRQIMAEDFLFVLENDKRYNKSIFTLQQYYK